MIGSLITSQTRIKLLKKFFLNSNTCAYLRGLEAEFGESSNAIRVELNRLEEAGLLTSEREGNRKLYRANCNHPLFGDIHNIILKETGIDKIIENVIHKMGNLISVYLTGDFAQGRDSNIIELILVGDNINLEYLGRKIAQAEDMVGRKVEFVLVAPEDEVKYIKGFKPAELLTLWEAE
ncbi:MAG TPA: winged helix-turn-helix domain-containing protein [Bacteroidales bacterium]|nr:winged helix-turn-helix transcriptional regulator [Bacteroidales bacterium]HRC89997.1 winged helix-turn-helix domain-containing protein [Bacteroidales bacterium]